MKSIADIRAEIDVLDKNLTGVLKRRLELADEMAAAKRAVGAVVTNPAREREILSRATEAVGPAYEREVATLYASLFGISKARQRLRVGGESEVEREIAAARDSTPDTFPTRAMVACCGAEGAYAQQAVSRMFRIPTILYFHDFEKVFKAVEEGLCPYGVLPIENSAAGSVAAVYDLMQHHHFHIVRALRLKVDHVLLAKPGTRLEDVNEIASHPHALTQCRAFIKARPEIRVIPSENTAVAARELGEDTTVAGAHRAVIASRACADLYGLEIIAEGIADTAFNYTRFICISKRLEIYPSARKFSVMMSLPHRPGALNEIVSKFAAIDVNLTKLESRPIPGLDFEFRFTFDFEAPPTDGNVIKLLAEFSTDPDIEHFEFLGAYAE